jgi:predicted nucleotidyltransferase
MNRTIAIYPGRFQPFGKHHAATFMWLQNKFGKENAYIVTSDKVEPGKSPFNFNEKKAIIELYGIDPSHIIKVKNPYNPVELYGQFDLETTSAVFLVGEKDMGEDPRFKIGPKKDGSPSFFQSYKGNEDNLQSISKHGYLIAAPHVSLKVPGYGEMSGTEIRTALGDTSKTREEKKEIFQEIFGWYSDKMANYIFDKLENKISEKFSKDWWVKKLITEATELYKVVYRDIQGDEVESIQRFNNTQEAEKFVASYEWESDFERFDGDGNLEFARETMYYNPDDKQSYYGYSIEPESYQINEMGTSLKEEGPCWDGYKQIGMKKKGKKKVPNCVPINEGGNVFGTTSPIAKSDIEPTLEVFVDRLSKLFPSKASTFKTFEKLGSVGKKELSGDIDLAYDVKNFFPDGITPDLKGWGLDETKYKELVAGFTKRAKNASPEKINLRAIIALIEEKIDNAYDDIEVDSKGSGSGALFCSIQQYDTNKKPLPKYVQVDVNIGNLDWLTFSYYSNTYSGNVKGLHRTQLMLSLFANKNYTFSHGAGVVNKETGEKVANNSQEAIALLNQIYGFNLDRGILNDYFKLEEYIKATLTTEEYNAIIDRYLKILDSTRADIPENLQDYWIANQSRLGLKGKFLPADSKLIQYQTLNESGSAGGGRIGRSFVEKTKEEYIKKVLSKFPGFKAARISGSYNTSSKEDFGDIDLIVMIEGDDKKKIKQELAAFLSSLPDDVIVPFKSEKYKGKKTLSSGELVTILYPIVGATDEYIQIDNIIAISEEESNFKQAFLDYPAEIQGLLLGLSKAILLEEDPQEIFKRLGIKNVPELGPDEEYEFNLSSVALTLRIVKLSSDFKEIERKEVWKTTQWNTIKQLFSNFNIDGSFEDLLYDIVRKVKNPRSRNRIKGIFKSMISIKSGEVGTPKGVNKQRALDKVADVL